MYTSCLYIWCTRHILKVHFKSSYILFSLSVLALFFSPNGVCLSFVRMEKLTITNVKLLLVMNLMACLWLGKPKQKFWVHLIVDLWVESHFNSASNTTPGCFLVVAYFKMFANVSNYWGCLYSPNAALSAVVLKLSYKRVCFRTSRGLNMWTKESAVDRVDKWPVFMMHQTCSQGTFKNIHYFSSSSALFFNLHVPVFFLFGMERSTILNVWILPVWKGMACLWQWRAISNAFPLIQMSVCL